MRSDSGGDASPIPSDQSGDQLGGKVKSFARPWPFGIQHFRADHPIHGQLQ